MKLLRFKVCVFLVVICKQVILGNGEKDLCNKKEFFESEGEIETPGYPYRLGFNKICSFIIDVGRYGNGRIELTFLNVSLPERSVIGSHPTGRLYVGQNYIQSRVVYSNLNYIYISIWMPSNFSAASSDRYGGVKLRYRRISEDVCKRNFRASDWIGRLGDVIESPGYPNNYNVSCEYYIDVNVDRYFKDRFVQIGFQDFSLGPNDLLTMYDAKDNNVLLGPLNGSQDMILTKPTNSYSVKIVVKADNASFSGVRRYAILYKAFPRGSCIKHFYLNGGTEQQVLSEGKPCEYVVRSSPNRRILVWFESINISFPNRVTVSQKSPPAIEHGSYADLIRTDYLTYTDSGRVRSFDSVNKENWFEIKQSNENPAWKLKFIAYSDHECPFYVISEAIEKLLPSENFPNSSCEYYIRSKDWTGVIHVRISELFLSSGDDVTIYDASNGNVIARYDGPVKSVASLTTNSHRIRVVFTTADTKPTSKRKFKLYHKTLFSDTCIVDFKNSSGQFSSVNGSKCIYNINVESVRYGNYNSLFTITSPIIELKLEDVHIPRNSKIRIQQTRKYANSDPLIAEVNSQHSGKTLYFRNEGMISYRRNIVISIHADAHVWFRASFKPFVSEQIVHIQGTSGTILSPYYPSSYQFSHPAYYTAIYYVQIPRGRVELRFIETQLAGEGYYRDKIDIYDGNMTSKEKLIGTFKGYSPKVFTSSSNFLTMKFHSFSNVPKDDKIYRFKATYASATSARGNQSDSWKYGTGFGATAILVIVIVFVALKVYRRIKRRNARRNATPCSCNSSISLDNASCTRT